MRLSFRLDRTALLTALVFALAAAACRMVLTQTETRSQLLVMFAMLGAAELAPRYAGGRRSRIGGFALNCAAVFVAVLLVKFILEGRPHLHPAMAALSRLLG